VTGVLDRVEARCDELTGAMKVLRFGSEDKPLVIPQGTEPGDGQDVHKTLLDVRARLDLAETLKLEARKLRREFRRKAVQRRQEADEAFDKELKRLGEGAVRLEWQSGREREASARTTVLEQRRTAITAETARSIVEAMFDDVQDMFFGLLNIREELIARLRELQFETVLER
jgi:hypothetical protein